MDDLIIYCIKQTFCSTPDFEDAEIDPRYDYRVWQQQNELRETARRQRNERHNAQQRRLQPVVAPVMDRFIPHQQQIHQMQIPIMQHQQLFNYSFPMVQPFLPYQNQQMQYPIHPALQQHQQNIRAFPQQPRLPF